MGFYSASCIPASDHTTGDMQQLTEQAGGSVTNVGHDVRKLEQAFDQIQDEPPSVAKAEPILL